MQPNHLEAEELEYELNIRGVISGRKTINSKRKILHTFLQKERNNPKYNILLYEQPNFNFLLETEIINKTLVSLCTLILEFEGGLPSDSTYKRIQSRIIHITDRTKRLSLHANGDNAEEINTFKNESYATCLELEGDLEAKIKRETLAITANDAISLDQSMPIASVNNVITNLNSKCYPVHKWNIKYDGNPSNLYSFLEEIEELRISRRVSEAELFQSVHELFEGTAKNWVRQNKASCADWGSFITLLKHFYLPKDPNEQLWIQIKARMQGTREPTHVYVAIMETLFSRLSITPSVSTKIKQIRCNLLDKYWQPLALTEVETISQLLEYCRTIDEEEARRKNARLRAKFDCVSLESNLAYVETSSAASSSAINTKNYVDNKQRTSFNNNNARPSSNITAGVANKGTTNLTCWNCKGFGHTFPSCPSKLRKFCFKCGNPNHTSNTCVNCSKNGLRK